MCMCIHVCMFWISHYENCSLKGLALVCCQCRKWPDTCEWQYYPLTGVCSQNSLDLFNKFYLVLLSAHPNLTQTSLPITSLYLDSDVPSASLSRSPNYFPIPTVPVSLACLSSYIFSAEMSHLGKTGFSMHLTALLFRHILGRKSSKDSKKVKN